MSAADTESVAQDEWQSIIPEDLPEEFQGVFAAFNDSYKLKKKCDLHFFILFFKYLFFNV